MLLRFAASNFRSLRDKQEFSLAASNALKEEAASTLETPISDVSALRVAALYGANASGKTNILKALHYVRRFVVNSQTKWKPSQDTSREPFRLDQESATNPTEFDLDLVIDGVRYTYGFAIDDARVVREHLSAYPHGRPQVWFERDVDSEDGIRFGKQFGGENKRIWSLTRPNSLFLSAAAQNNHKLVLPVFNWFSQYIRFAYPGNKSERTQATIQLAEQDGAKTVLMKLLESADLGIVGVRVRKLEPSQKLKDQAKQVTAALRTVLPDFPADSDVFPVIASAQLLHKSAHDPAGVALPLEVESDGTQALFAFGSDIVETLSCGGVLAIDELEESLHPLLAMEIIKLFSNPEKNPRGAQLVFTTHNTTLLARRALRRDQIWFTEKDTAGATRLYALTDFRPRRDENLETGYLQGRYGAIPFLDNAFPPDLVDDGVPCGATKQ